MQNVGKGETGKTARTSDAGTGEHQLGAQWEVAASGLLLPAASSSSLLPAAGTRRCRPSSHHAAVVAA